MTPIQTSRRVRRALNGKDKEFFLSLNPMLKTPFNTEDTHFTFYTQGLEFSISFDENGENGRLGELCSYKNNKGIKTEFSIPESVERRYPAYPGSYFGKGQYSYSLDKLATMFPHEPFCLEHLTVTDLKWYGNAVRTEMEEWDKWLKDGTISKDKHDDYLSCVEERILTTIAPYMSDIKSMVEYIDLFLK